MSADNDIWAEKASLDEARAAQKKTRKDGMTRMTIDDLFLLVDTIDQQTMTKDDIIAAAAAGPFGRLGMNEEEALELFDQLDKDVCGTLIRSANGKNEAIVATDTFGADAAEMIEVGAEMKEKLN